MEPAFMIVVLVVLIVVYKEQVLLLATVGAGVLLRCGWPRLEGIRERRRWSRELVKPRACQV
jgi:hypothetical protein